MEQEQSHCLQIGHPPLAAVDLDGNCEHPPGLDVVRLSETDPDATGVGSVTGGAAGGGRGSCIGLGPLMGLSLPHARSPGSSWGSGG